MKVCAIFLKKEIKKVTMEKRETIHGHSIRLSDFSIRLSDLHEKKLWH